MTMTEDKQFKDLEKICLAAIDTGNELIDERDALREQVRQLEACPLETTAAVVYTIDASIDAWFGSLRDVPTRFLGNNLGYGISSLKDAIKSRLEALPDAPEKVECPICKQVLGVVASSLAMTSEAFEAIEHIRSILFTAGMDANENYLAANETPILEKTEADLLALVEEAEREADSKRYKIPPGYHDKYNDGFTNATAAMREELKCLLRESGWFATSNELRTIIEEQTSEIMRLNKHTIKPQPGIEALIDEAFEIFRTPNGTLATGGFPLQVEEYTKELKRLLAERGVGVGASACAKCEETKERIKVFLHESWVDWNKEVNTGAWTILYRNLDVAFPIGVKAEGSMLDDAYRRAHTLTMERKELRRELKEAKAAQPVHGVRALLVEFWDHLKHQDHLSEFNIMDSKMPDAFIDPFLKPELSAPPPEPNDREWQDVAEKLLNHFHQGVPDECPNRSKMMQDGLLATNCYTCRDYKDCFEDDEGNESFLKVGCYEWRYPLPSGKSDKPLAKPKKAAPVDARAWLAAFRDWWRDLKPIDITEDDPVDRFLKAHPAPTVEPTTGFSLGQIEQVERVVELVKAACPEASTETNAWEYFGELVSKELKKLKPQSPPVASKEWMLNTIEEARKFILGAEGEAAYYTNKTSAVNSFAEKATAEINAADFPEPPPDKTPVRCCFTCEHWNLHEETGLILGSRVLLSCFKEHKSINEPEVEELVEGCDDWMPITKGEGDD